MWKSKKGYLLILLAILFLTSLILSLSYRNATGAAEPSERFKGYNKERGGFWTTGNLGKLYVEGDFVSYQLRIAKASKVWGATEFSISFNFHQDNSKAIYVDGFDTSLATGFQWSTQDFLPDGKPTPDIGWGTHIPTPEGGETWTSGPKITNYMNAWPVGTSETPSDPADERYFTVNWMPWGSAPDHVILFFRAHLALNIVWSAGLEKDLPKVLDGDEFQTWVTVPNALRGASFATGSSRHFYLQYPGIGQKDIPIPIAMYPSTIIKGHKYVNDVLFNTWEITLTGQLSLGPSLPPIPYNPPPVYTGTSPWTTGYFEFTGLIEGSYNVTEENRAGYSHGDIVTSGPYKEKNIPKGWVTFDLVGGGMQTVDFYNSAYADLTVSKIATTSWKQTITWAIVKTATPAVSKIFVNDTTDVKYTITVTATPATNVYGVSGNITIDNPNLATLAVKAKIRDEVWDGVLVGSQDVEPIPILIPLGVSKYPYSITLPDVVVGKTYTNRAIVEVTTPVSRTYMKDVPFSFTAQTELVDKEVNVSDSYAGFLGTVHYLATPKTFEYTRTFGPYLAVGVNTIENTATAKGLDTGYVWKDSETVTIQVFDITVSKTAVTYWEQVFKWSIGKTVEAAQLNPFINDQIEVRYTINVVKTVDKNTFEVSGIITIVNNNPAKKAEVTVIDKIYADATFITSKDLGSYTIDLGKTLEVPYKITFPATLGTKYTNKAYVKLNNYHWSYLGEKIGLAIGTSEFIGVKDFTYTEPPNKKINDSVKVTDVETFPDGLSLISSDYPTGGWTTDKSATFVVNKIVKAIKPETWLLEDEAFAEGTTQTWSTGKKTLVFTVYDISVSKTAEPWWERSFDWTIDKSVSPAELTLYKGETGTVTYTVIITKKVAGDKFKVSGSITIVNNNPEKTAEVYVIDKIYDGTSVIASQDLGTREIAPGATLNLSYEIIIFSATPEKEYTNRVHVDLKNYMWKLAAPKEYLGYTTGFTGDSAFKFTAPTKLIDNSATVAEDETVPPQFSAVVDYGTHGDPPWTVTESTTIVFTKHITEVSAKTCTWYNLPNTVTLTESDTGAVHTASALVRIHVSEPPPPPRFSPSFDFKCKVDVGQIQVGLTKTMTIVVYNTGIPQSRIYYLTFTAVIGNYTYLNFVEPYTAHIIIYYNDGSTWEADVLGDITYEKFAGFDIMGDYWMVTWRVPTTYPAGPYLEGNYGGYFKAKAEISFKIMGAARGSTWLVFFPRATEDHHSFGVPLGSVTDKANIWESDGFWYPVHNSYDPYDDIGTGHAFIDLSWAVLPTTNQYARAIRYIDILP